MNIRPRLFVAALTVLPNIVSSQTLRGRVTSADSTRVLPGVILLLRDSADREVARTLSNSSGSYVLRAPIAGSYRLRTLRIGYQPGDFGPFALAAGRQDSAQLALADIPVSLAGVRVSANNECHARDANGEATLQLWGEARKALLASVLARTEAQPTVTVLTFTRALDPESHRVIRLTTSRQSGPSARPFLSVVSPEAYAQRGYQERDSLGTITMHAPDADVLLSESFASGRCFQVARDPRDTLLVGLAFRPSRDRDGIVDVEGTMWLDRATAELRRVDIRYTGLDPMIARAGAFAQIDFIRLDNGLWLIDHWLLHMPRIEVNQGIDVYTRQPTSRRSIADLWESGGEIVSAKLDAFEFKRDLPVLTGQLVEEGTGRPGTGSTVSLVGTDYRAASDTVGHFAISSVLPGKYQVAVRSPAAAALGDDAAFTSEVDVAAAETTVSLKSPSLSEALRRACGSVQDSAGVGGSAVVQGVVRRANGSPARDATVTAHWLASTDIKSGLNVSVIARQLNATTTTDREGRFRMCGLPVNQPLRVSASADSAASDPSILRVNDQLLVATTDLRLTRRAGDVSADAMRISGVVRDETGAPIPGVTVAPLGGAQPAARTDSGGKFDVSGLSAGMYVLQFRSLGYATALVSVPVGLVDVSRDVAMHHAGQTLGTVVVNDSATTGLNDPTGFSRRRATAQGAFLDAAQIEAKHATTLAELLRSMPGIRVGTAFQGAIGKRGGSGPAPQYSVTVMDNGGQSGLDIARVTQACAGAQVFVDGVQMESPFDINTIVPSSIKAIEAYKEASNLPVELWSRYGALCGTIAIWLK